MDSLQRRGSWATLSASIDLSSLKLARFALGLMLVMAGASAASLARAAQAESALALAWQGTLQVDRQEGVACASEPVVPHERRVVVSAELTLDPDGRLSGRLFFSGDSQAMEAVGSAGRFALSAFPATADAPAGQLALQLASDGGITGDWREAVSTHPSVCSWTEAQLTLEPAARMRGPTESTALTTERAFRLAAELDEQGSNRGKAYAAQRFTELGLLIDTLVRGEVTNLALARMVLAQADAARFMGLRAEMAALTSQSLSLHRVVADQAPEATAEALARQATVLRSERRRSEAEGLYLEALQLLGRHGLQSGASASAVSNSLGALYLRMERTSDAARAFRAAVDIDRQRNAVVVDLVGSMNNLAHALGALGQKSAALSLYDEALALLNEPDPAHQELAKIVRSNAAGLRASEEQGKSGLRLM